MKGFAAMAVFPFVFVRGKSISEKTLRHEKIHFAQQKELLIVFFYLLYLIFWIFKGYRNIPFEKEAYSNQNDFFYLKKRRFFAWIKYLT